MSDKVASRLREFIRKHEVITGQGGIVTACDGAALTLDDLRVASAALESMSAANPGREDECQQPAAVDGETAQRAAKALLDARSYIGPERPDDPDDEDSAQWWDELTELAAALAAQPGGSDNDR